MGEPPPSPGFAEILAVEWLETTASRVAGRVVVNKAHLQPYGIVHGGVWASIAESAASIGAHLSAISRDPEAGAVGLENHTTFLRAAGEGATVEFEALPVFAGRRTQAWEVVLRDAGSGKEVARSQVRLMVVRPGEF